MASLLRAQETRRIRFAVTNPPHFLPIWLARDTGIFSKHGLDVEIIFMRGSALITMGILSGELQLSGVGAESVVAAKLEGGDAVLLSLPIGYGSGLFDRASGYQNAGAAQGQVNRGDAPRIEHSFLFALGAKVSRDGRR